MNPQPESYWSNVTPVVPQRGLRRGQAARRGHDECVRPRTRRPNIDRVHPQHVRSRIRRDYGRAVPTIVSQTLRDEPITVHGAGSQKRSPSYINDLGEGLWRLFVLLVADLIGAVNLDTPEEVIVPELAERIRVAVGAVIPVEFTQHPEDAPQLRGPDISLAGIEPGWGPKVPLETGLERRIA